jgi:hypothetical protein
MPPQSPPPSRSLSQWHISSDGLESAQFFSLMKSAPLKFSPSLSPVKDTKNDGESPPCQQYLVKESQRAEIALLGILYCSITHFTNITEISQKYTQYCIYFLDKIISLGSIWGSFVSGTDSTCSCTQARTNYLRHLRTWTQPNLQCLQKIFRPLDFFHMIKLQHYSKID